MGFVETTFTVTALETIVRPSQLVPMCNRFLSQICSLPYLELPPAHQSWNGAAVIRCYMDIQRPIQLLSFVCPYTRGMCNPRNNRAELALRMVEPRLHVVRLCACAFKVFNINLLCKAARPLCKVSLCCNRITASSLEHSISQ